MKLIVLHTLADMNAVLFPSSDDLLLQEGGIDVSSIASQFECSLNITQAPVSAETSIGIGIYNHGFSGSLTNLVQR